MRARCFCASFVLLAPNVGDLAVSIGYFEWQSLIGDGDICTAFVVCTPCTAGCPKDRSGGGERERFPPYIILRHTPRTRTEDFRTGEQGLQKGWGGGGHKPETRCEEHPRLEHMRLSAFSFVCV
jgi:hypothetical protein